MKNPLALLASLESDLFEKAALCHVAGMDLAKQGLATDAEIIDMHAAGVCYARRSAAVAMVLQLKSEADAELFLRALERDGIISIVRLGVGTAVETEAVLLTSGSDWSKVCPGLGN